MWRGSLLPLGCEAAPKPTVPFIQADRVGWITTAAQPSGSKLPRHRSCVAQHWVNHRSHPN
ncbi:hypothetical protein EAH78_02065 [Pseudomonas arsenicoxydans]|uniref:Uncharacterized protein n=1 Tax=Pseudomonas arsenicoxydans TaxID=702115 RepID=A0A502I611_9PSED|nr:hypothetical protein EAH78_02065 [Pseudomonas arsenicoxydans]